MSSAKGLFKSVVSWSLVGLISIASLPAAQAAQVELLNVSYDPTRELYQEFNAAFAKQWETKTGDKVTIK